MILLPPTAEGLAQAAQAIRAGQVVAYPTETSYGLAADPFSGDALRALFEAKNRETANPILVIISGPSQLEGLAAAISPRARAYMEAFWPGPLSLLLPKENRVPRLLTAGFPKVCVRCPACPVARDLCDAVGGPITSTSANLAGRPPARSLQGLELPGVSLGIDAGSLPDSPPSTIFDPDEMQVIREGAVPREKLLQGPNPGGRGL